MAPFGALWPSEFMGTELALSARDRTNKKILWRAGLGPVFIDNLHREIKAP